LPFCLEPCYRPFCLRFPRAPGAPHFYSDLPLLSAIRKIGNLSPTRADSCRPLLLRPIPPVSNGSFTLSFFSLCHDCRSPLPSFTVSLHSPHSFRLILIYIYPILRWLILLLVSRLTSPPFCFKIHADLGCDPLAPFFPFTPLFP